MSYEALRQEASCRFAIPVVCLYRVSVAGVGEGRSDCEGVVATFCLIRYQTMIARTRETNFARQFSSVSLVHKMETKIARQFFESCRFIFAVQKNFPDALTKRLPGQIALNSPTMANRIPARVGLKTFRRTSN